MSDLIWRTEKRKINELVEYEHNPRILTDKKRQQLENSLKKFGLVEIPVIDPGGKIIAGHQRIKVLQLLGRGDESIEVRVPSRKLTDQEFKEYNILSNTNVGIWNIDILEEVFGDVDLDACGLDINSIPVFNEPKEIQEKKISLLPNKVITGIGDVYELISIEQKLKHVISCGDSKNKDVVNTSILRGGGYAHFNGNRSALWC